MNHVEPKRYFWVEDGSRHGRHEYHWLADCPWLTVELSRGATLVSNDEPPTNARETTFITIHISALQPRSTLPAALRQPPLEVAPPSDEPSSDDDGRWLCAICYQCEPQAEPVALDVSTEPCATCHCPKRLHETKYRNIFARGCAMGWTEVLPLDAPLEERTVGILHCRCDGFRPMSE